MFLFNIAVHVINIEINLKNIEIIFCNKEEKQ